MPSIDVAMARSVRGGVGGIVARSLQAAFEQSSEQRSLEQRDIAGSISSVKDSFSSWDNCMAAVYCKWPAIALMILAGLIVFSVIWCIARCLCCGLSCCCECCHCLKCCGQCCGCCDPPNGGRRRKHLDEPYNNIPDSAGYKREDPMAASALPFDRPRPTAPASSTTTTAKSEPPQYASFDISKKHADGSDDDLPAMPVWGESESKKIQLKEEAVELQQLKPPEPSAPLLNGMSPAGTPRTLTPVQGGPGPYGVPGNQAVASGYFANVPGGAPPASPYYNNMPGQGYSNQMQNSPYGQSTTSFQTEQSWGITPGPMPMNQGQQRPQHSPGYGPPAGYAQEPGEYGGQQPGYSEYGAPNMAGAGPNQQQGYRNGPPARSMTGASTASTRSGYPDNRARGSPAPSPQGGFDRGFDPRIMPQRTASPVQHSPLQQQQGAFDPRLMGQQQRTGSPALQQQQGAFDPRAMPPPPQQRQLTSSPAPMQGGFDQRGMQPQRTASPARFQPPPPQQQQQQQQQFPNAPARSFSPAPGPGSYNRGPPQPQRQMSADPQRGHVPPYRQDSGGPGRQQQHANSPRPGQQRMPLPPSRSQTMDRAAMEPPRSPGPRDNFSRPMRSNTFDQAQQGGGGGGGQQAAYPGYKPYQPGR